MLIPSGFDEYRRIEYRDKLNVRIQKAQRLSSRIKMFLNDLKRDGIKAADIDKIKITLIKTIMP